MFVAPLHNSTLDKYGISRMWVAHAYSDFTNSTNEWALGYAEVKKKMKVTAGVR